MKNSDTELYSFERGHHKYTLGQYSHGYYSEIDSHKQFTTDLPSSIQRILSSIPHKEAYNLQQYLDYYSKISSGVEKLLKHLPKSYKEILEVAKDYKPKK